MTIAERIANANKNLPTINIQGKNYVMVKDRVVAFRKNFPDWSIVTEIVSMDELQVTMKATVADETGRVIGTGHAQEIFGSTNINKTSAVENCESSCIGRAVGLACAIGIDDSFGSADEIANAQMQQAMDTPCSEQEIKRIKDLLELTNSDPEKFLSWLGIKSVDEMTKSQYARAAMQLQKKEQKNG